MKAQTYLLLCLLVISIRATCFGQKAYFIDSYPDSAEVFMNGASVGFTPTVVRENWTGAPLQFTVKKKGYKSTQFFVNEKPKLSEVHKTFDLARDYPFTIDSTSDMVGFDKLRSAIPIGKLVGFSTENDHKRELTWEGFFGLLDELHEKSSYATLHAAGFKTPYSEPSTEQYPYMGRPKPPRFILSATIYSLDLNISLNEKEQWQRRHSARMKMQIEWKITDKAENKIVLVDSTTCKTVHRSGEMIPKEVFDDAYKLALEEFLQKGQLANYVNSVSAKENAENVNRSKLTGSLVIAKSTAQKAQSMSDMIQNATTACTTIETDQGHGSGSFISSNGYVLTANHVVDGAYRIDVILSNDIRLDAEVISYDVAHDVALLKVAGNHFPFLPIGSSANSKVGVDIFTIGTPSDVELGQSVSKGIVSGKRKIEEIVYIQTDVPVSPGNSGGPLINNNGEVIGIIQKKLIGFGVEGVGFALPIEIALEKLGVEVK